MNLCDFGCGKIANYYFKSSNKYCCSASVNSCVEMRRKNSESNKNKPKIYKNGHPRARLGHSPPSKGKTYEELYGEEKSEILKKAASEVAYRTIANRKHSEETKQKISEITKKRHEDGWDNKAGRCEKYRYDSTIAGNVSLDGTWELKVAKWLDSKGYNWKRNTKSFPYYNLEGKLSSYTPDFWVDEFNSYLEIKGYETDLDRCKWSQFPEKLLIWKKEEVFNLDI